MTKEVKEMILHFSLIMLILFIACAATLKMVGHIDDDEYAVCEFEHNGSTYYVNYEENDDKIRDILYGKSYDFVLRSGFFRVYQGSRRVSSRHENPTNEAINYFKLLLETEELIKSKVKEKKIKDKRDKEELLNKLRCN